MRNCVPYVEAIAQMCSVIYVFLKVSQNSQESTFARVFFLIKLQAEVFVLLYICCIFSENLFLRTASDSCFWAWVNRRLWFTLFFWHCSLSLPPKKSFWTSGFYTTCFGVVLFLKFYKKISMYPKFKA